MSEPVKSAFIGRGHFSRVNAFNLCERTLEIKQSGKILLRFSSTQRFRWTSDANHKNTIHFDGNRNQMDSDFPELYSCSPSASRVNAIENITADEWKQKKSELIHYKN